MADYFIQYAPISLDEIGNPVENVEGLFMITSPEVKSAIILLANILRPQGFSLDILIWGPGSSTLLVKERRIYEENNGKVFYDHRRGCYVFLSDETIGAWRLEFSVPFIIEVVKFKHNYHIIFKHLNYYIYFKILRQQDGFKKTVGFSTSSPQNLVRWIQHWAFVDTVKMLTKLVTTLHVGSEFVTSTTRRDLDVSERVPELVNQNDLLF